MDDETTEYVIEEIEYVDFEEGVDDIEIIETQSMAEQPSTSKDAMPKMKPNIGTVAEENLVEKLIGGEITLSEYDNEGTVSDTDSVTDIDEERSSVHEIIRQIPLPAREIRRSPTASQSFENELDKSRKDAMRGLLQGRDELRDGRQRRRCVLPAALQGNAFVRLLFIERNHFHSSIVSFRFQFKV